MKHFPQHLLSAIRKLVRLLFPVMDVAADGGVDCTVFDEAHRQAWHDAGFSDEEVQAICVVVACCTNEGN